MNDGFTESEFFTARLEPRSDNSPWTEQYAIRRKDDGSFVEWHPVFRDMNRRLKGRMSALDAEESATTHSTHRKPDLDHPEDVES